MGYHRGINMSSVAGSGLNGLPGLLITIAFVFIFAGIFLPRKASDWLVVLFFAVEIGAAVVYVLIERRNRKESERLNRELHTINDKD